jgi:hypothetical protein
LEKMQNLGSILSKKNYATQNPGPSRVNHSFQVMALTIIKKLNVGRPRYSAYFAAVKRENPQFITAAFSFAVDHPNVEARDKMFFWKLNDLKNSKTTGNIEQKDYKS